MPELYVQAAANVLGLRVGERAILPDTTYELMACIQAGLILLVGEDGTVPEPRPEIRRPCGCGS